MKTLVRAAIVTLALCLPSALQAQITLRTGDARADVGGRVQLQFATTSVSGEPSSEFLIRRARLNFTVTLNDFLSGRLQPEFGLGTAKVRDAWIRMTFSSQLRVTFGQFKKPFDLFELTSSTETLVIERTGVVAGAGACPGVIFCSYSTFSAGLFYSDRDVGVMVDGSSGMVDYGVSITNGWGQGRLDNNGAKTFTGRLGLAVAPDVHLGLSAAINDFVNDTTGTTGHAPAIGGDLDVGNFEDGVHFRVGLLFGDNWRNIDSNGDVSGFVAFQTILSYKIPVSGNKYVEAIEPLGRVSWSDADMDLDNNTGVLLTPGVQLFFTGRNKLSVNVDIYKESLLDTQWSLKSQMYFFF
jgi:Phosphate-selective porin O and P